MKGENLGVEKVFAAMGYETKLFDTSKVHTIDIVMEDWEDFTANCKNEEYYACSLLIDNEVYKNAAIRGKGNTSLTQVEAYGNNRYSFKIEFDHYDDTKSYYGLDKLCLNNIIQDNTYMKDYLAYQMMREMGAASPLCSYVYITVNGRDWGLYLAVEGVEEAFLRRNYGSNYGELYKPDSMKIGGGKESGENHRPGGAEEGGRPDGGMGTARDDVLLKYVDDKIESYSNIFDNAKTDITHSDKTRLIQSLKNLSSGENLGQTIDMEAVIRYFVVHNFLLNFDSYTGSMIHNYYLYEKDGQMQMIPWDYNLSFGGFQSMDSAAELVNYPIDSPVSGGEIEERPMLAWIFSSEEYTEMYHQYFRKFILKYYDSGYFEELLEDVTEMIDPYVEKDPTKFCTYEEYKKGVSTLREFCLLRMESISGQLAGKIGASKDTQESSTLVNPGDLNISDMGSMEHGMGGERMGKPKGLGQKMEGNSRL
jgi:spore coat protein CotH